eukprot:6687255-Lingulodinium_polyedra.AAC.1
MEWNERERRLAVQVKANNNKQQEVTKNSYCAAGTGAPLFRFLPQPVDRAKNSGARGSEGGHAPRACATRRQQAR